MVKKRLAHLDPLIAFEAAARRSSFALAAQELNITASAVSQQIRGLEASLGVLLFERLHRRVRLTERGKTFQNSVSVALTHLANAVDEVQTDDDQAMIEIATDTSVSAMWLLPRLPLFDKVHPGSAIRLFTTDVQSELLNHQFQVAIIHGQGNWVGCESSLLFEEEVFPVCSPDYLNRFPEGLGLDDLHRADLLDLDYEQWSWMNWAIWFTEKGLPPQDLRRKMRMNSYPLMIDAARQGAGIALGWRHLVDQDLLNGTLVQPVQETVRTPNGYYLVWPYNDTMPPTAAHFRDWCKEQATSRRKDR